MNRIAAALIFSLCLYGSAFALPGAGDRVYTADQNSNTVSVINPARNELVGQIRLGNARPDVFSPLYRGEVNVHGLGFSPDHKTLLVVSTGSNAVTFINTTTNEIRGTVYVGRSPHEGFFTPDGREAWVVVRGESHISVIDPVAMKETRKIETSSGPGMVIFDPKRKYAYVASSFTAVFEAIDTATYKVVKKIPVVSPFSPYLVMTPDGREIWLTHKDVGKITRIDAETLEVKSVFDTGFITNHVHFAKNPMGVMAYVTVGGENVVKVYTLGDPPELMKTILVGSLPHGIWPCSDGSRLYVGLENNDAVDVIDAGINDVVARIPVGQAPQALVFVPGAVEAGTGEANLTRRPENMGTPITLQLEARVNSARGVAVVRNLGLLDWIEVTVYRLSPDTVYRIYAGKTIIAALKTNSKGAGSIVAIGPIKELASSTDAIPPPESWRLMVMEADTPPSLDKAVLIGP